MSYLLNLSSPQTYEIFKQSTQKISGFPIRQKRAAERVRPGDTMLCYMTGISRWFGALDVISGPTIDDAPIYSDPDPYVIRFEVRPIVLLEIDQAIPIRDDTLWKSLSFTRNHDKKSSTWTAKLRSSLTQLDDEDGQILFKALKQQTERKIIYPLDQKESERLKAHTVRRADRIVSVSVPADLLDEDVTDQMPSEPEVRESIRVQALIADIGAQMGLNMDSPG